MLPEIFIGIGLQNAVEDQATYGNTKSLSIYTDDLLTLCHKDYMDSLRNEIMEHCGGINLKLDNEVHYLNMTIANVEKMMTMAKTTKLESHFRLQFILSACDET